MQFLLPLLLGFGGQAGVRALLAKFAPQLAKGLVGEGLGLGGFFAGDAAGRAMTHEHAANHGEVIPQPKAPDDNMVAFQKLLEMNNDDGTL